MITVGIDHGTSGIKVCIKNNNNNNNKIDYFTISRNTKNISFLQQLEKFVKLNTIDLIVMGYSMGDGFNKIMPIDKVKNRGVLNIEGVGLKVGKGTKLFDEIKNSNIPTLLIPGIHKNTPCIDDRFKVLYSHITSPEKIAMCYCAHKTFNINNFILSDISSNTVTLLIKEGKIFGGFDACIGAPGILHGPIDLELIRNIDNGKITANQAFSTGGVIKSIIDKYKGVENTKKELLNNYKNNNENCKLAIESLILGVAMEISSLSFLNNSNNVVLAGSVPNTKEYNVIDKIKTFFLNFNIKLLEGESGALGGALIGEDILKGKRNILGLEVDF